MINWNILQPVDIGRNFQTGYETGSEMVRKHKLKGALAAYSADPNNPDAQNALAAASPEFAMHRANQTLQAQAQAAEKARIGQYFTNPDRAASKQQALSEGELDIAKQIDGLGEDERKRAAAMYKFAAPVAYEAMKLPYEQRKAFVMQAAPQLIANGWTQEQIDAFDPSDASLGMIVQTSMTLDKVMERDQITYKEVAPGARLVPFDSTGRPVGGPTVPIDNPEPSAATGDFNFTPVPGAQVTSAYRTAQHNTNVGGVPNSYHTRKDANGNAMARDFVPPQGMSMDQLFAETKRLNPGLDVINEGDHVHIEPRGGGTRQASGGNDAVRRQAQEAIAAGADPAAVRQRAASMGVSL